MTTIRMPDDLCVSCGRTLDAASGVNEEETPAPGDFSVCFYCGQLMVFGDDLRLREPTTAEARDIAADPAMLLLQRMRPKT